jgi:Potential Queuosine, Q, salvage protein family
VSSSVRRVPGLCDEVRQTCAGIAAAAQWVTIDLEALGQVQPAPPPALDPVHHYLEGSQADVATYVLVFDSVNFGSGWFPTLRKRPGLSGYFTVASAIADRFRAHGAWTPAELRAMRTEEVADTLGQPRDHELMALHAQALRSLGGFLGEADALTAIGCAEGSAERLATQLAGAMTLFADRGFYKRAQIVPADLQLAGVARFADLDRLTIFADNVVPHVLRCDGVLVYDERLASHIDEGRLLRAGQAEREIRACAVHACELIARQAGTSAQELDNWLWNRGRAPEYKRRPRHRCRTVYY